ncbi:OmpA family protein [Saccharicrinis fermentans]|uniref:Root adhesin n=1 Tax=Saccharicrinis fermentans DSM 9555 = JCM 21142 TaxID=869213 RepID=W7Y423_9BACT|nr:OmpA family protein [Saccharicrinis fermentans]GAF05610.1 root adhesin [Saccharicrinis fermentans DSM 9555 = JCM 21142]
MRKLYVKHFIALSFIFTWFESYAQVPNMVLNPSFEVCEKCPEGYTFMNNSHVLIPNWTYPTATTPDYFNECGLGEVKVPDNFAGYSKAKSGKGYVGAILSGSNRNFREYIQGTLDSPMIEGQKYCVSFWYKLASGSKFAVDQLSIHFTTAKILNDNSTFLNLTADLTNKEGLFLDNTEEWAQFCQVYTAKGGEQCFVVGNFNNYDNTNYVVTGRDTKNKKGKSYAYYFFDDFEIRPLVDCNMCACVPKGLKTVVIDSSYTGGQNPVTGHIDRIINDGTISIGISGGEPPYRIEWSNGTINAKKIQNLKAGSYTYYVSDKNNCHSEGTVVFKEPVLTKDAFTERLRNIEEGGALILNNIFFETAKSTLLPTSFEELDKVVNFLKEGTVSLIEISGHTDNVGSDKLNQSLSQRRANSVVKYLVSKGVSAERIKGVGYGESKFIDTNKTEVGRSKNRRVEFSVLKK